MSKAPGGLGAKQPNDGKCSCCGGKCPDPIECPKRKGCGKCGTPQPHQASKCKELYPKYDKQVCDECLGDHEVSQCSSRMANACEVCGHNDHKRSKCPIVPGGKFTGFTLSEFQYDQFTPEYRKKYLRERAKELLSAKPATSSPTSSSQRAGASQSPPKSPRNSQTGLPIIVKGSSAPIASEEEENPIAARRKKWDEAEKLLPKRKSVKPQQGLERIKANFFKFDIDPKVKVFKYSITLGDTRQKDEDNLDEKAKTKSDDDDKGNQKKNGKDKQKLKRETKRFLIESLLDANPPLHNTWATDYNSIIVSREPLYQEAAEPFGNVTETPHQCTGRGGGDAVLVKSYVTCLGEVNLKGLKCHVEDQLELDDLTDVLKCLNIISWKSINSRGAFDGGRVGNRFYPNSTEVKNEVNDDAPLYRIHDGFFSSMRPGQGSLLLNVNAITSAFFSPINLQTWIDKCWPVDRPNTKQFKSKFKDIRVTFNLHKPPKPSRLWVICGLSNKTVSETTFNKEGREIKVSDYMKSTYNHHWVDKDWEACCINVGSGTKGREIWYPATQLSIVDWQIVKEILPTDYSSKMIKRGEKRPMKNKMCILDFMEPLGLKTQSFYESFGLTPSLKIIELGAPKVNPPKLIFHEKNRTNATISNGSWNLAEQSSFVEKGTKCLILNIMYLITGSMPNESADALLKALVRYSVAESNVKINSSHTDTLPALDLSSKPPPSREVATTFKKKYRTDCQEIFNKALSRLKENAKENIPFILVVLPRREIPLYAEVKRWGDCEVGIPTVCITSAKLRQEPDATLCANICLKINSKLRGVSHKIQGSGLPTTGGKRADTSRARKNTMIVGADVTHPKEGQQLNCPSIAGVVATDKDESSCYLASARLQKGKQEHISDLTGMMKERVIAWYNKTKGDKVLKAQPWRSRLPNHILFYRDGVSESQYGMVLHEEKDQILDGCQQAFDVVKKDKNNKFKGTDKWNPNLTLLVVTKRHHARFFPMKNFEAGKIYKKDDEKDDINLKSGLVVDTVVVDPIQRDFYLQSHHSALGTARSGHYIILHDDNDYDLQELQQITYNLCYTSARATKAVSVCIPARYADLLCDRLRCYMKPALDGYLKDDENTFDEKPKETTSPRPSISGLPAAGEDLKYIKEHEDDPRVWKRTGQPGDRKNPWHPNIDNCMFYV